MTAAWPEPPELALPKCRQLLVSSRFSTALREGPIVTPILQMKMKGRGREQTGTSSGLQSLGH